MSEAEKPVIKPSSGSTVRTMYVERHVIAYAVHEFEQLLSDLALRSRISVDFGHALKGQTEMRSFAPSNARYRELMAGGN